MRKALIGTLLAGLFLLGLGVGVLAAEPIQEKLLGQLPASRMVLVSLPAVDTGWNGPTTAYDSDWAAILADHHKIGSLNCNPQAQHAGLIKVLFVQRGGYYGVTCWESDSVAQPTPSPAPTDNQ